MGLLTKLFGYEGTVRFEGETIDGKHFSGKVGVECIAFSKSDIENEVKKMFFVETGKRIKSFSVIAFYPEFE